jgi:hypothetical protein
LDSAGEMKFVVKKRIDDLQKSTNTNITCVGSKGMNPETSIASVVDVEIAGYFNDVERARQPCLILLDEAVNFN